MEEQTKQDKLFEERDSLLQRWKGLKKAFEEEKDKLEKFYNPQMNKLMSKISEVRFDLYNKCGVSPEDC